MTPAWPGGDPRDVARAILAGGRFRLAPASAAPAQRSWWDVAWAWVVTQLKALLGGIGRVLGGHNPLETVIGFGLIGAALLLLGLLTYRLVRSAVRVRGPRRAGGFAAGVDVAARSSDDLRAAALAAARAGRFREAAALLFAAAVRGLDEGGRIAYDPARTPGEYRRLVRDPAFDALAGDTVVALFAAAEPSGELFERMCGNYEKFLAAAPA